jgi:hypothetical protein
MSDNSEVNDKMYAVVNYTDGRKENIIRIDFVTPDLELAKKVAFQGIKEEIPMDDHYSYKIVQNFEDREGYISMEGQVILDYMVVGRTGKRKRTDDKEEEEEEEEGDEEWDEYGSNEEFYGSIWAVVEVGPKAIDAVEDIDESLLAK